MPLALVIPDSNVREPISDFALYVEQSITTKVTSDAIERLWPTTQVDT
jgi:hypothetical protein